MNPPDSSLPSYARLFGDHQMGSNNHGQAYQALPESPFSEPPVFTNNGLPPFSQTPPASNPIRELAAFSLRHPKCPQCKGKRFDFTAYFHNPKVFNTPPHELLDLVERSYILKNRLESILVTYIVHDLREDHRIQDSQDDVHDWVRQVASLAVEVKEGMIQGEGVSAELAGVQAWTEGMANRLGCHLERANGLKMEVPKGWKKEVLCDFRKQWEKVWISCASAFAHSQAMSLNQEETYQDILGKDKDMMYSPI